MRKVLEDMLERVRSEDGLTKEDSVKLIHLLLAMEEEIYRLKGKVHLLQKELDY